MTFTLSDHGTVFATRKRGACMLAALDSVPEVLDFSRVERVSYSFADEFVGKLLQRTHDRGLQAPTLLNMGPDVGHSVKLSLANRNLSARTKQESLLQAA
jgi:hypothetical protein